MSLVPAEILILASNTCMNRFLPLTPNHLFQYVCLLAFVFFISRKSCSKCRRGSSMQHSPVNSQHQVTAGQPLPHTAAEGAVSSYLLMAEPFVLFLFRRIQPYSLQTAPHVYFPLRLLYLSN